MLIILVASSETRMTDEAIKLISINTLKENKIYYLIDQLISAPKQCEHVVYQQIGNKIQSPNSYYAYQGSSSN